MILLRYLIKQFSWYFFAVAAILLVLFASREFIHYLGEVAQGKIPLETLFQLTAISLPQLLTLILPLCLFLSLLIALSNLHAENEWIALLAHGVSSKRLITYILLFVLPWVVFLSVLSLFLLPKLLNFQEHLLQQAKRAPIVKTLQPGKFNQAGNGTEIFYAAQLSRDRLQAQGIFIAHWVPSQRTWNLLTANAANTIKNQEGEFLQLQTGHRYVGVPGKADFQVVEFKNYYLRLKRFIGQLTNSRVTLNFSKLWQLRQIPEYRAELAWRISLPLAALILCLMAIPLSYLKPRQSRYSQMLPAILIYIVYVNLLVFFKHRMMQGEWLNSGMWLVHLLAACLFIGLSVKSRLINFSWKKNITA